MVDFLSELMSLEKNTRIEIHKRSGRTLESFNSTIRFPEIPSATYEIAYRETLPPEGRDLRQVWGGARQVLGDRIAGQNSNKKPHAKELHRTTFRLNGPIDISIEVYHDREFPHYAKITARHLSTVSTEILEQETFLSAFGSYYYVRKFQSEKPVNIPLSQAEKLIKTRPAVPDPNKRTREIVSQIELLKDDVIRLLSESEDDLDHLLTDLIANRFTKISPEACRNINFPQLKTIIDLYQELENSSTTQTLYGTIKREEILREILLEANYLRRVSKERAEREKSISVSRIMNLLNQGFNHVASVMNRNLVMFWGGTGAGKSTSINFYLGHELKPWEGSHGNGKKGLGLNNEQDLKPGSFAKIGESIAVSETAFVHGYPLMENVLRQLNHYRISGSQDLTLCDCPGFDDTRGIEYDLCTALSIQQAIRKSRSLKAVVLTLPYNALEVNKGNLVVELFENLSNTIQILKNKDSIESINARRSIFLLITKLPIGLTSPDETIRQIVARSLQEQDAQEAQERNRSASARSTYLQKRIEIWRLINEVCSSRLLVFRYDDNCQETIKSFLSCPGIDKRLFQNTLERPDIQSQFGNCLETSFGTWKTTILERYHRDIPTKISEIN